MEDKQYYFNAKELAAKLKPVDYKNSVINNELNLELQWLSSDGVVDVLFWMDSQKSLIKQQVQLYGQIIEWNILDGVRSGVIVDTDSPDLLDQKGFSQQFIQYDKTPNETSVIQALQVISDCPHIDVGIREELQKNFKAKNLERKIRKENLLLRTFRRLKSLFS